MSNEEIINKINEVLSEEFEVPKDRLKPQSNLKETLELDSLDYVDMIVLLENNFPIKVKQEDFLAIHNLNDLYSYVIMKTTQHEPV